MKKINYIVLLLLILTLFSGCESKIEDVDEISQNNLDMQQVDPEENLDNIKIPVVKPRIVNVISNKESTLNYALRLVYDSLFSFDKEMNLKSKLAKNFEMLSTRELKINLRENVKWHDQTNFSADDVIYTINLLKTNSESPYHVFVNNIKSVSKDGENSIFIELLNPDPFAVENFVFPIVKQGFKFEKITKKTVQEKMDTLIGTGPYKYEKGNIRKQIELKANNEYYLETPQINRITLLMIPDKETQKFMLESYEVDTSIEETVFSGKYDKKNFVSKEYFSGNYEFLAFNFSTKKSSNLNFRKMISYAVDRKKLLNQFYLNKGENSNTLMENKKSFQSKDKFFTFNLEKAIELKQEFSEDKKIILGVMGEDPSRLNSAQEIKAGIEKLGFVVEVKNIGTNLSDRSVDIILFGTNLSENPTEKINFLMNNVLNKTIDKQNFENLNQKWQMVLEENNNENLKKNYFSFEKELFGKKELIPILQTKNTLSMDKGLNDYLFPNRFDLYSDLSK